MFKCINICSITHVQINTLFHKPAHTQKCKYEPFLQIPRERHVVLKGLWMCGECEGTGHVIKLACSLQASYSGPGSGIGLLRWNEKFNACEPFSLIHLFRLERISGLVRVVLEIWTEKCIDSLQLQKKDESAVQKTKLRDVSVALFENLL